MDVAAGQHRAPQFQADAPRHASAPVLRMTNVERLSRTAFDVLVIGGGINGAVSASALASRGASVALVDRGDFGAGTSQASSNLAWGGNQVPRAA